MLAEKYTYLILNFLIIIFPLLFTFDQRIKYYKKLKNLFFSIFLVSFFFIMWDIFFTKIGLWRFNENYITGLKIYNLPIEEIIFFFTVPYSLLFIYEVLKYFLKEKKIVKRINKNKLFTNKVSINQNIFYSLVFTFLIIAFIGLVYNKLYFFVVVSLFSVILFFSKNEDYIFWKYNLIGLFLFLIFNYILTSLPVVIYYENILFRVLTIPIEDFFYNFILLSLYLKLYKYFNKKKNNNTII